MKRLAHPGQPSRGTTGSRDVEKYNTGQCNGQLLFIFSGLILHLLSTYCPDWKVKLLHCLKEWPVIRFNKTMITTWTNDKLKKYIKPCPLSFCKPTERKRQKVAKLLLDGKREGLTLPLEWSSWCSLCKAQHIETSLLPEPLSVGSLGKNFCRFKVNWINQITINKPRYLLTSSRG